MQRLEQLVDAWLKKDDNCCIEMVSPYPETFSTSLDTIQKRFSPRTTGCYRHIINRYVALNPFYPFDGIVTQILKNNPAKYDLTPSVYFIAPSQLGPYVAKSTRDDYESFQGDHKRILYTSGLINLINSSVQPLVFMIERFDMLSVTARDLYMALLKHTHRKICLIATVKKPSITIKDDQILFRQIKRKGRPRLAQLRAKVPRTSNLEKRIINILTVVRLATIELFDFFNKRQNIECSLRQLKQVIRKMAENGLVVQCGDLYRLPSDAFQVERYNLLDTSQRMNYHQMAGRFYEECRPDQIHLQAVHYLFSESNAKAFEMFINLGQRGLNNGTGIDTLRELNLAVSVLASIRNPDVLIRKKRVELYYLICHLYYQQEDKENGDKYFELFERFSQQEDDYLEETLESIRAQYWHKSPRESLKSDRRLLAMMKKKRRGIPAQIPIYARAITRAVRYDKEGGRKLFQEVLKRCRSKYQQLLIPVLASYYEYADAADRARIEQRLDQMGEPPTTVLRVEYHFLRSLICYHHEAFDDMLHHQDITLHLILELGDYRKLQSLLARYTSMNIASRYYTHVHSQVESLARESSLFLEYFSRLGIMSELARIINRNTGEQKRAAEIVEREIGYLQGANNQKALARSYELLGDIFGEGEQTQSSYKIALDNYRKAFRLREQTLGQATRWDYFNLIDVLIKLDKTKKAREYFNQQMELFGFPDDITAVDLMRLEAMLLAAEGDLTGAKKIFKKIVAPEKSMQVNEQHIQIDSIGRGMFEYGQFLYANREHPKVGEPIGRILEVFNVVRQIFMNQGDFYVYLQGALDMIEQINRENYYEVVMQEKQETLFKLMESLSAINAIHDMGRLLPRIMDLALETVKGSRGLIYLDMDGVLYPQVNQGFQNAELQSEGIIMRGVEHVHSHGKALLSTSREINEVLGLDEAAFAFDLRSIMIVPIRSNRGKYGVIYLDCHYFANVFNKDSIEILTAFANQAAIAIENVRLFESATRDGLTGLYGHVAFREIAGQEFAMSQRYDYSFAVCIMDLDNFKKINDTFGHAAGNRALVEFSQLLRTFLRDSDIISRYGGDEFEIILPRTKKEAALRMLERFRKKVEQMIFIKGGGDVKTSTSIGVAAFPQDGNELEALFRRADKNLYRAKREGKNRIGS